MLSREDMATMTVAEEKRLGVNSLEFAERHNEIMNLIEQAKNKKKLLELSLHRLLKNENKCRKAVLLMIFWKRINCKKEFERLDKENIEYYRRLEIFKIRELICKAIYKCEDEQSLKTILKVCCVSSGMRFVDGGIDTMHLTNNERR